MNRKKYRLRTRLCAIKAINSDSPVIYRLQEEINHIELKVKNSALEERRADEQAALRNIRVNSKAFFKYAKKFKKSKSYIKLMKKADGSITTDFKEIVDLLQNQFASVFSEPTSPLKVIPQQIQSSLPYK